MVEFGGIVREEYAAMELAASQQSLLDQYLQSFRSLIGDKRTEALFRGVVAGIISAESLVCSRIAAFSPCASG